MPKQGNFRTGFFIWLWMIPIAFVLSLFAFGGSFIASMTASTGGIIILVVFVFILIIFELWAIGWAANRVARRGK